MLDKKHILGGAAAEEEKKRSAFIKAAENVILCESVKKLPR